MCATRAIMLTAALAWALLAPRAAAETVPVPGSTAQFDTAVEARVASQPVKMLLTGAGLRVRGLPPLVTVKVYAVGSYVEADKPARTADDLLAVHTAKQLRLVMERDVDGPEMAESIRTALRANHPAPRFARELARLRDTMQTLKIRKGDHVHLTHTPGQGLTVDVLGQKQFVVGDVQFSRAIWEIFFGRAPLDETLKRNLLTRTAP